jgi:3-phosphoshikimate 1-carboxyvinyltransferase
LDSLGVKTVGDGDRVRVKGKGGRFTPPTQVVDVGNSGTTLRFITSLAGLVRGRSVITGDESLRSRPMGDLIACLVGLGVSAVSMSGTGTAPIEVMGTGRVRGGEARITGSISSQFVSSLLIPSPYFEKGLSLEVRGELKSRPYVDLTVKVMQDFGIAPSVDGNAFAVEAGRVYSPRAYVVDGDYSSASFIMAAGAITGSKVRVGGLRAGSLQADEAFPSILGRMGCKVRRKGDVVAVEGGDLIGIDADLSNSPDLLPPLSVVAAVAKGPTTVKGVEHARLKESDRIAVIRSELARVGIGVEERPDGLVFRGGDRPGRGQVFSHGDHRIAMALAVLGLVSDGLEIKDASCVSVSYPDFVRDLSSLGADLKWL